jgi:hypothetical protein
MPKLRREGVQPVPDARSGVGAALLQIPEHGGQIVKLGGGRCRLRPEGGGQGAQGRVELRERLVRR